MKIIKARFQDKVIPERSFFGPNLPEEQRQKIINDHANPLNIRFKGIGRFSFDGLIWTPERSESDERNYGLDSLDTHNSSAFLDILKAMYPLGEYEIYGYNTSLDLDMIKKLEQTLELQLIEQQSWRSAVYAPLKYNQEFSKLTRNEDSDLLARYFNALCVFRKGNGESAMATRFWLNESELDLKDPYYEMRSVPGLLKLASRVIKFREQERHQIPEIYGRNLDISRKREILTSYCEKENIRYEETKE